MASLLVPDHANQYDHILSDCTRVKTLMKLLLAPMEGVLDPMVRDLLTRYNPYDLCVTEFLRVVDNLLSRRSFYRLCPELHHGGFTTSGTPVRVQLLGQSPHWLAENACRAIELGSHGVDLNFGCPAKTVNQSQGGAVLLKTPEQLYQIVKAVRDAVPQPHIVSAKIRLGYTDNTLFHENAHAIAEAGASLLTVHARTKSDGYKPPAYWPQIKPLTQQLPIPIIANGEIWQPADAQACREQSGCADIMVGRGALSLPNLGAMIKQPETAPMSWPDVLRLLIEYGEHPMVQGSYLYYPNRVKQWFHYLKRQYPEAAPLFNELKTCQNAAQLLDALQRQYATLHNG